jgi:hypothetical protein
MQYPHWLIIGGAVLVALGFIGFAFRKDKNVVEPDDGATEMKTEGNYQKSGHNDRIGLTPFKKRLAEPHSDDESCWRMRRRKSLRRKMAFSSRVDLRQGVVSRIFRTFIMRRLRFQIGAADRAAAYSCSIWPTTLFRRYFAVARPPG